MRSETTKVLLIAELAAYIAVAVETACTAQEPAAVQVKVLAAESTTQPVALALVTEYVTGAEPRTDAAAKVAERVAIVRAVVCDHVKVCEVSDEVNITVCEADA